MATKSTALVPLGDRDYIAKMTNQGTPDDLLALVTTKEAKALSDVALVTKVEAQGEVWHHVRTYINEWLVGRFPVFDELAIRIADRKRKGMSPLIIKSQPCDSFKQAIRLILECDPSYFFKIRKKHYGGGWQKALPAEATTPDKPEVAETSVTDIKVGEPDAKDAEVCDPVPVPMPSDETVDKVHSAANETATEINVLESEVVKPRRAKTPDFRFATSPNGHTTWELKSWLQKSIRRGLEEEALYAVVELDLTGFPGAVWETLHHSASEDIGLADPNVCVVVGTLHRLWKRGHGLKETASEDGTPERLYLVHAVLACVHAKKSRLVDNALMVAYGDHSKREVPSWAHDKHTDQGKKLGRGFAHFFDEAALLADKDGSLHKPNDAYAEKARAICIAKEGETPVRPSRRACLP
ncbi:MAG: hypothetical protein ABSH01_20490 [Terriglobia bacterium]|jgi:hypothetical protein